MWLCFKEQNLVRIMNGETASNGFHLNGHSGNNEHRLVNHNDFQKEATCQSDSLIVKLDGLNAPSAPRNVTFDNSMLASLEMQMEVDGHHTDNTRNRSVEVKPTGLSQHLFCWGTYDAPEARPWVLMHAVVGICVIHFSIAISQAILYTASTVADSNQRMPTLFGIRAGNTQIAVNIIVSIINIALLPTIGAVSDYTRYRYHVGCIALLLVCCSEFVSASASQQVPDTVYPGRAPLHLTAAYSPQLFGLMMGTAVVFGVCFQTWYLCLRIAYVSELAETKASHARLLLRLQCPRRLQDARTQTQPHARSPARPPAARPPARRPAYPPACLRAAVPP